MTQGSRTTAEVQQQVLTYIELKKSIEWISVKTGLGKTTIKTIKNRGEIKYSSDYKSKPGRPKKVSQYEKKKIVTFVSKHGRKTLNSTKTELNLSVSKQTLSRVFREIGIGRRKMKVKPTLTSSHSKKGLHLLSLDAIRYLIGQNGYFQMKRNLTLMDIVIIGNSKVRMKRSSLETQTLVLRLWFGVEFLKMVVHLLWRSRRDVIARYTVLFLGRD